MPTQVSLLDGALASAGTLAIQTNGTTSAITISSTQVATFVNNPIMTGLTASRAVFTDASKGLTSNAITGTGNVVMSDSPTLVTPNLGTPASGVVTNLTGTASININGTVGATTPSTGAFTTLSASSTVSGTGFSTYLASPPAIGGTLAAAGSFTTLSASSTVSGTGFSTYLASPPAIGGTAAAAGSFTNLSSSGTVSGTGFTNYLASPPAIGGTAANTGSFTTLTTSSTVTLNGGTANGVLYLNGSKVATSGSALTFDGTKVTATSYTPAAPVELLRLSNSGAGDLTQAQITFYAAGTNYAVITGGYNGAPSLISNVAASGYQAWQIATNEQMRLTTSGLGIGTSSPGDKLAVTVNTANAAGLTITNSNNSAYFTLQANGSTGFGVTNWANSTVLESVPASTGGLVLGSYTGSIIFQTGARSERMRIDSSGVWSLGDTGTVASSFAGVKFNGASYNGLGLNDSSSTSGAGFIYFQIGGTTIGNITRVAATSAVSYNTTSDIRLKNDQGLATQSRISNVKVHNYTWKADGSEAVGVFAQELSEVIPEAVTKGTDELNEQGLPTNPWGVDYSKLVPDLILAVQQLQAEVASLKSQLKG